MEERISIPLSQSYSETLERLLDKADDIRLHSQDYSYKSVEQSWLKMENPKQVSFEAGTFNLTPFSSFQLCNKLGMPSGYFERLTSSDEDELKELAVYNINLLAGVNKNSILFRTYKNDLRGVLSTRYAEYDTDKILRDVDSVIRSSNCYDLSPNGLKMRGDFLSLDRFHMRFSTSTPLQGLQEDDLYAGLMIDSSDVGRAKLSVRFFIYKQMCTNGMVMGVFDNMVYAQRHINITSEELRDGLNRSISNFPTMVTNAQNIIRSACENMIPSRTLNQLRDEESPVRKNLKTYFRLSDKEMTDVMALTGFNYDNSVWGLANAVTQVARDSNDIQHRLDLEVLAGRFIRESHRLIA